MYPRLPKWCLTNKLPAFYDLESATAVEQTAKVYGAMQGLIDDYNKFAEEFNKTFEEYVNGLNKDHECFQNSINKIVHDYIAMLDEKIKMQDKVIEDAVKYMKDNLSTSITHLLTEMKEMGELDQAILDSIDGIGTRVSNLETEVTNINTSLNTLDETDSLHNSRITTLEINVAEIQENENGLSSRLTNQETKTNELETKTNELETTISEIANIIYPIGSIYLSVNSVNPTTLFGGTWENWGAGKVPVGVDLTDTDFATVEKTGGEKTHTLTIDEIPSHKHILHTYRHYGESDISGSYDGSEKIGRTASNSDGSSDLITPISNNGGDEPHNNLQPYITCYMWKRIG